MKYLEEQNLLDGNKRCQLSVVCDNCPGQNKNNHVVRLAPYLVEKGYFKRVQFVFLVAGHTKNQADRRFNNMKETYHKKNLYTMDKLVEACNESSFVEARQVFWRDFYDYKSYFDSLYTQCDRILRYQHFYSTEEKDIGVLYFRTSDTEFCNEYHENIIKKNVRVGTTERQAILAKGPEKMYMCRPGLKERKQVELYQKWRHLLPEEDRDITCPKPTAEVETSVKEIIKKKQKEKQKEKKKVSQSTEKKTVVSKKVVGKTKKKSAATIVTSKGKPVAGRKLKAKTATKKKELTKKKKKTTTHPMSDSENRSRTDSNSDSNCDSDSSSDNDSNSDNICHPHSQYNEEANW